jgi:acyl transferase domain-containing protein
MSALDGAPAEDVAIIGMACMFPGAPDLGTYWENIVGKVDAVGDPPPDDAQELSAGDPTIYTRRGGYLGDDATFDPIAYGVMPASVIGGEPDHFLALRVAYEALADAGYLDGERDGSRVEVILGKGTPLNPGHTNLLQHSVMIDQTLRIVRQLHPEHSDDELAGIRRQLEESLPALSAETVPALVPNVVAGRIANRLDLMGVNYTIDAACASSLIAVERGVADLRSGACDLALVGGVQGATPPPILFAFCRLDALSRNGCIRPFDKDADGTLLGEGLGMVVLKRRSDAERDGDRIYALVKGVGAASDGRALGLLAPRLEGEVLALRRAYDQTGVDPRTIDLVEAHGTGTLVGDATEIKALGQVFGPREPGGPTVAVGTVKSMISHLIPAAGIAGLIKTALALHHRVLPPTLHCDEPSPALGLDHTSMYINTDTRPWVHGGPTPRRAGVNAFGFGGINTHAVLQEYRATDGPDAPTLHRHWDCEVFILVGRSRSELLTVGRQVLALLDRNTEVDLIDLAASLNTPMRDGESRLAVVAADVTDLRTKLGDALQRLADPDCMTIRRRSGVYFAAEPNPSAAPVFLFPGEGSQYPGMLADLCIHFPEVLAAFDRSDRVLGEAPHRPRLAHLVHPPSAASGGQQSDPDAALRELPVAVAAVSAANMGLLALLHHLHIAPAAVAGHSSGELTALLAGGAVPGTGDEDLVRYGLALREVHTAMADRVPAATLLTVGGAAPDVVDALLLDAGSALHLAMDNCPHQTVLCGPERAVHEARRRLEERGAVCSVLAIDRAYHTPLFTPIAERLHEFYRSVPFARMQTSIYSCATAELYPDDPELMRALAAEQWMRPVRFRETVNAMYDAGHRIFVEVGAKGTLTGFVRDTLRERPHLAVAGDMIGRSGTLTLNHLIGQLAVQGVPMRLDHLYERRTRARLDLDGQGRSGPARRPGMRLSLALPTLRLSGSAPDTPGRPAEPDRPGERDLPAAPDSSVESAGSNSRVVPRDALRAAGTPGASPGLGSPAWRDGRTGAMTAYFSTMESFLTTEGRVLGAVLARPAGGPSVQAEVAAAVPSREELDTAVRVGSLDPGRSLTGTCRLDPLADAYLHDHQIGRPPSVRDADLNALIVEPLAMSVRLMTRASALLVPDCVFIGMREVRAHRWLALDDGPRVVHIEANREPSSSIAVNVRILDDDRVVLVEGTALFAGSYPVPPSPLPAMSAAELAFPLPPAAYYDVMFHGPAFKSVTSIDRYTEDGMEATLRTPPDTPPNRPGDMAAFDPVLLDGALQLAGFWAWHRLERGFTIFPVGGDRLDLYGPPPPRGTPVRCSARIRILADGHVSCDADLLGPDGFLTARLTGWRHLRLYDWTRRFTQFALNPADAMLSYPTQAPELTGGRPASCCHIDRADVAAGTWPRVLAQLVLTRAERTDWQGLTGSAEQRREWLLRRVAAKDAVRQLVTARRGVRLAPADIELAADGPAAFTVAAGLEREVGAPIRVLAVADPAMDRVAYVASMG